MNSVAQLAKHYDRSLDQISIDEIRDFVHHLITVQKLSSSTCNQRIAGINFFYRHVLGQTEFHLKIPLKRSGRLPEPLSRNEISRLIEASRNLKHRALMIIVYGGGLRVSELVRLKPEHIHSDRMLIRVDQGKGRKDRYTLLSPRMLAELRSYWASYRPTEWLFTNLHDNGPLPKGTAQQTFYDLKRRAGITHGRVRCLPVILGGSPVGQSSCFRCARSARSSAASSSADSGSCWGEASFGSRASMLRATSRQGQC